MAEEGSGSQVDTAEEAIWWTLTTMTTVGDGDIVPETTLGRAVAMLTMFAGIGVFGAFTALIASLLVQPKQDEGALEAINGWLERIEEALSSSERPEE